MTNITVVKTSSGGIKFDRIMYWQNGMPTWEELPSSIPDKETTFAIYWISTESGIVCGYVDLKINDTKIEPIEGYRGCVISIGTGMAVKFKATQLPKDALLQINVSDKEIEPIITPTPTPTPVPADMINVTLSTSSYGKVKFDSILYWQNGMSKWEFLPKTIPDKETSFAVYWISDTIEKICGYANLKVNGIKINPTEGNGNCVTTVGTGKSVKFNAGKLPKDAQINIDVCDTAECPPTVVVCRKGCIAGTFTYLTGNRVNGICEQIPNSPECGYIAKGGFIKCQAFDSVTNAALNVTVQIDGVTIVPKTPCTTQALSPGTHRITFIHDGYATNSTSKTVVEGQTVNAYGVMVKEDELDVPGFNVEVNIPGLLPKSALRIMEVSKVPFTTTWWDSPFGTGMKWDNISNGTFKARMSRSDCIPVPTSHSQLRSGQDYVIYVGTSAISLYPSKLVHRLTNSVTPINLTDSYVDWVSSNLCAAMDITPVNCPFFIASSVSDAAFFLELWTIITKHENLAGEHTLPTALDYALFPIAIFGMLSPGISEGKIVQTVGRRITELIPLSKKGTTEIKAVMQDPGIDTFLLRATDSQFNDFVKWIETGAAATAKNLLKTVDDAPLSKNDLHALQRASKFVETLDSKLIKAGSVESTKSVLKNFSPKFKEVFRNALKYVKENPHDTVVVGAAGTTMIGLWYALSKLTGNVDSSFKSDGITMSSTSWGGKDYINVIETYKYNVIDAERLKNWTLFCENLLSWEKQVDNFEAFVSANQAKLNVEGYYDIFTDVIAAYRKAIEIKHEVHTCVDEALPEVINAEVIEILDSDTIKIRYNEKEYTVRLLGINAPEGKTYDYTCTGVRSPFLIRRLVTSGKECIDEETWTGTEELYNASKVWLGQNLPVHQNALFYSDQTRQFDKYGRLLALPRYSNKNICVESLKAGMSVVFFYDTNKQVSTYEFLQAEKAAKDAKIGVWATEAGTGTIRCVSNPTAAEVWLDGVYTEKKTISSVAYLYNIPVGEHTIELKKIIDGVSYACSKQVTVTKDTIENMSCTLTGDVKPTPKPTPTPTPTPDEATWYIGYVKDKNGATLNVAKVHVDSIYVGHYAPELLRFCNGCRCDNLVSCGFGSHTVTIKKTGYKDWIKTRTLKSGDEFTDNPVMELISEDTFPVTIKSYPSGAVIKVDSK